MTLPPNFLDELRTRLSLADVIGRKVIWDARKSQQGKGEFWAPCPFHHEKTPSFKVDDRMGRYYCFGCQAKGDAITFVMETENTGFMEAVELLAGEAGMEMPKADPKAQEKADKATQIIEVCELALKWFRLQLKTGAASEARIYLDKRGLDQATQDRFEIGFAPDSYDALLDALASKNVPPALIAEAGLSKSRDGRKPYALFRDRIIFPIRDVRGRCVAFGGRAMQADNPAKYLNSPETLIFKKTHTLYNHAKARAAAGKGQPLLVAEGYMDVIALVQAGFEATVATLGTAMTESHLSMIWRFTDEPILAMDGDKAGLRAAQRVVGLALPLLQPGKSVRFAVMPDGKDPDDILRETGGKAKVAQIIESASPLIEMLWQRETDGRDLSSPERRAAFDRDLRVAVKAIADPSVRSHYGEALKERRFELFRANRGSDRSKASYQKGRGGKWSAPMPMAPSSGTRMSALASGNMQSAEFLLEACYLAVLARHPELIDEELGALESFTWLGADHAILASNLMRLPAKLTPEEAHEILESRLPHGMLDGLWSQGHIRLNPALKPNASQEAARMSLEDTRGKLQARRSYRLEVEEARDDLMEETEEEALTWRVKNATEAQEAAYKIQQDGRAQGEENSKELSDYLQSLLDQEIWKTKKG